MKALLDTGRPALWDRLQRHRLARCLSCEYHPPTQGHDAYCPQLEEETRARR
jgi:hypothetical protein